MSHNPSPVFIIGAPRSGTTLVYRVMCLHPQAAWVSNWSRRFPSRAPLAAINRIAPLNPRIRRRAWFGDTGDRAYRYGETRPAWERAFPQPSEGEPVMAAHGVPDEPAGQYEGSRAQQAAVRAALDRLTHWSGGTTFVSKRIANNRRIKLLLGAYPDARFVHLVRDGRAVAASLANVDWWPDSPIWWAESTPRQMERDGHDPWEVRAQHWVRELEAIRDGLDNVRPDHQLTLRYEELVASPSETFAEIAAFSSLSASPTWRREISELAYPDQNERWRERLGEDIVDAVSAVQAEELARYGYR